MPPSLDDLPLDDTEEDQGPDMPDLQSGDEAETLPDTRQPKPVDPKVLDILRDEAAFEAQQRARDANGLETQPELGLLGAAPWPSKSETRSESPRAQSPDPRSGTSSSAFPDIDDISASLEPIGRGRGRGGDKNSEFEVPATSDEKKRSFLRGLILPLALAVVLIALYLAAPVIIGAVPATAPALTGYVSAVDGVRGAIVGLLGS